MNWVYDIFIVLSYYLQESGISIHSISNAFLRPILVSHSAEPLKDNEINTIIRAEIKYIFKKISFMV